MEYAAQPDLASNGILCIGILKKQFLGGGGGGEFQLGSGSAI